MSEQKGMGRRQFLVLSSIAVASAAVAPKLFADEAVAAENAGRVAVGFAPMDEKGALRSASDIMSGDGAFISRGARLTVFGAYGASENSEARRVVDLSLNYASFDGEKAQALPFHAWGASRASGTEASPTSFTVPVDADQQLSFIVRTQTGRPPGTLASRRSLLDTEAREAEMPVALTTLSAQGQLKIARGYYVLVPLAGTENEPRWSEYRMGRVGNRITVVGDEGNVAPFEHLLVRVDYASK
ncbi:MAG: twin-arginine translocation signal domain-containing protein [Acidobacteriota bacterium]|nr:twin-arginine translocation signal domain-containing protein [Acidobacteriota bacterium]